jgi:hypothetical protein
MKYLIITEISFVLAAVLFGFIAGSLYREWQVDDIYHLPSSETILMPYPGLTLKESQCLHGLAKIGRATPDEAARLCNSTPRSATPTVVPSPILRFQYTG